MPSSSSSTNPPSSNTFTAMSTADVDAIGAHCQLPLCHVLDFLPFRCESCHGTYCLEHRTESSHACAHAGAWARRRRENTAPAGAAAAGTAAAYAPTPKPTIRNHEQQCSSPACRTLIHTPLVTGVHCAACNRSYCLKHRMRETHDCAKLTPLGARPAGMVQQQRERGMAALEKLRAWGASKKAATASSASASASSASRTTGQKAASAGTGILGKMTSRASQTAAANVAALNKLKASAKGEASIPQDKRVYLHVEASADTTTAKYPTGNFFYNREWSVGRVLDMAAKALQVQNINNRSGKEEDKLRVFHVEGGRLLEFSEKLGQNCKSGNTIVLLRGVGPPIPDLIEA